MTRPPPGARQLPLPFVLRDPWVWRPMGLPEGWREETLGRRLYGLGPVVDLPRHTKSLWQAMDRLTPLGLGLLGGCRRG